ncbi:hypothetical protein ACH4ZX_12350 [Streptomyces sp. NPDC020490]|uniref:hypothetical protein n=1 Tax=Streptomyces sp. NPDC020490 TaxID=3365078 RepID=UPI0037958187
MTESAAQRSATALRHRKLAVDAFNAAQAQYEIAVLDHVTAQLVEAYPTTTHLTFDQSAHDRRVRLHGLWATRQGAEELLLDVRQEAEDTALDLEELADDLSDALAGPRSAAWTAVRPTPTPDRRRVLDLPPADRVVRIAELVRAHHPNAGLITVDLAGDTCRVLDVTGADTEELSHLIAGPAPADRRHPLWPAETERQIAVLTRQIHALPHLRAQHLVRIGGPTEHRAFLLLPQIEPEAETETDPDKE